MSQNERFTLSEIKRMNRQAKKRHAKATRKVETMRKLREQTHKLNEELRLLNDDANAIASLMWTPEKPYGY